MHDGHRVINPRSSSKSWKNRLYEPPAPELGCIGLVVSFLDACKINLIIID